MTRPGNKPHKKHKTSTRQPSNKVNGNKRNSTTNSSKSTSIQGSHQDQNIRTDSQTSIRQGMVLGTATPPTIIHTTGTRNEADYQSITDVSTAEGNSVRSNSIPKKCRASPEQISVDATVTQIIFPNMRFITGGKDDPILDYSEEPRTLCHLVMQECNITENKERFWRNARRWIASKLVNLRNDRTQYIQKAFFGKFAMKLF